MYLIFDTIEQATQRTRDEAIARGCVAPTLFWWGMVKHPTDGRAALDVGTVNEAISYPDALGDDLGDPVVLRSMPSVYHGMITMDNTVDPPVQVPNKYDTDVELSQLFETLPEDWFLA